MGTAHPSNTQASNSKTETHDSRPKLIKHSPVNELNNQKTNFQLQTSKLGLCRPVDKYVDRLPHIISAIGHHLDLSSLHNFYFN